MKSKFKAMTPLAFLLGIALMVMPAAASAQAFLTNLTINPRSVVGGHNAVGTVTLSGATTTALTISLQSSNPNFLTVPTSVTVPANASSANFTITTTAVTTAASYGVTATQDKIEKVASLLLTVDSIKSVSLQPNFVTGGFSTIATVALAQAAPTGGWLVSVSTDNGAVLVPASVVVPAGQTGVAFPVNTVFNTSGVAHITVKDSTQASASVQLDINALQFTTFDGPGGSPTTINGISNRDWMTGFTTQNNFNYNFLFENNFQFMAVTLGDPAGSLNALNGSYTGVGVTHGKAFSEVGGVIQYLNIPGATSSVAFGINDGGVIVGQYTNSSGNTPGFVLANGVLTTLLPIPTATVVNAQGVNNNGIVCGFYSINGVNQFPFLYNINTKKYTFPAKPSTTRTATMGLVLTQFLGINDNGNISGYY